MASELKKLEPAFKLRWGRDRACYTVSKPNIGDTDCYTDAQLEQYAADRVRELQAQVEGLRADAERYNAFFDAGLPITFLGESYETKQELDAAIDSARAGREDGNG